MPIVSRSALKEARALMDILTLPAAPAHSAGPTYAGLDAFHCPIDADMDTYWGAGFRVSCVYLANKPGRIGGGPNRSWIAAAPGLLAKGWGLAPTYVGAQASLGGAWLPSDPLKEGSIDAAEAVHFAQEAGFQGGQTIFLDVEAPFKVGTNIESYVLKWIERIVDSGFKAAIYSFPTMIDWVDQHGVKIWTVHLNSQTGRKDPASGDITWTKIAAPLPADPIDGGAIGTQGRFYCQATGLENPLDYDRWTVPDPSRM